MVTDEIRQSLIAMTRHYMEEIIYGIRHDTIDVEVIDRVFDACEDLLHTPPNGDDRGSWLYRLERPWAMDIAPEDYIRLSGLQKQ